MTKEPVLCYVSGDWAHFTTQELSKQWGDDWNDAPYEHNAGDPYEYGDHDRKLGKEAWNIIRVAFSSPMVVPTEGHFNSPYSVEDINRGGIAWLRTDKWHKGTPINIFAGTTLSRFIELIHESGGDVYLKVEKK